MAWKWRWVFDGAEATRIVSSAFCAFPEASDVGKRFRVTVEEEVNECCEKWRGRVASADAKVASTINGGFLYTEVHSCRPTFCPECGRRL